MSKCSGKNKTREKTRWQFSAGTGGNFQPEWPASFNGLGGRFATEYTPTLVRLKVPGFTNHTRQIHVSIPHWFD